MFTTTELYIPGFKVYFSEFFQQYCNNKHSFKSQLCLSFFEQMCFQTSFNTHVCNSKTTASSLEIKVCIVSYLTIGVFRRHQACLLVTVEYYRRGKTCIEKPAGNYMGKKWSFLWSTWMGSLEKLFDAADNLKVRADIEPFMARNEI